MALGLGAFGTPLGHQITRLGEGTVERHTVTHAGGGAVALIGEGEKPWEDETWQVLDVLPQPYQTVVYRQESAEYKGLDYRRIVPGHAADYSVVPTFESNYQTVTNITSATRYSLLTGFGVWVLPSLLWTGATLQTYSEQPVLPVNQTYYFPGSVRLSVNAPASYNWSESSGREYDLSRTREPLQLFEQAFPAPSASTLLANTRRKPSPLNSTQMLGFYSAGLDAGQAAADPYATGSTWNTRGIMQTGVPLQWKPSGFRIPMYSESTPRYGYVNYSGAQRLALSTGLQWLPRPLPLHREDVIDTIWRPLTGVYRRPTADPVPATAINVAFYESALMIQLHFLTAVTFTDLVPYL